MKAKTILKIISHREVRKGGKRQEKRLAGRKKTKSREPTVPKKRKSGLGT